MSEVWGEVEVGLGRWYRSVEGIVYLLQIEKSEKWRLAHLLFK